jgi:hypothetical protein
MLSPYYEELKKMNRELEKQEGERSPVQCCVMRPLGFYEVQKREKWTRAEWTEHGWKVLWSNWYQDDNDLDGIRAEITGA